jgi:bifunctional non-homologous end joining protein LigD
MPQQWSRPLARDRLQPHGFFAPCLPTLWPVAPTGPNWLHEIKHDGWRMIARRDGDRVRLWSRNGRDWSHRFALVRSALMALPVQSICLDGEVVAHCAAGLPDFLALKSRAGAEAACLYAFDILMLDGHDTRSAPLIERKARLAALLNGASPGLILAEHLDGDGPTIFRHACSMGLEGIVSKRKDAMYRAGQSDAMLKIRNPDYQRRGE